jgi:carbamate kinase
MRIVVAVGGTALLRRGDRLDASVQRWHIAQAARALAPIAAEHQLVICHGNGPQLGLLAVESEGDNTLKSPYPLDVLGAQTQGMIGYWLVQELHRAGVRSPLAALITQTMVADADKASDRQAFIGTGYTQDEIELWAGNLGWHFRFDGTNWRRSVPLLQPAAIREIDTIRLLADAGTTLVCGGGGGVPVAHADDLLGGVDAIVDKDLTAAMIAIELNADRLLILTDVDAVKRNFGTASERSLERATASELVGMDLDELSMGPKIRACARFTEATGRQAAIGALQNASDVLAGRAGTTVLADQSSNSPTF